MPYDRRQVKLAARSAVREAHPRPQLVVLVFLLLTTGISAVVNMATAWRMTRSMEGVVNWFYYNGYYDYSTLAHAGALSTLSFFLMVLLGLYTMVMHWGLLQYVLHLQRRQPASFRDLFSGFSMAGRVIALNLLLFLFSFLWTLLGCLIYVVILVLLAPQNILHAVIALLLAIPLLIFILNRIFRYAMANFLLLDYPELGALEVISRSKALMRGRICSYVMLFLSFLGWALLILLIKLAVWGIGSVLLGFSIFDIITAYISGNGVDMAAQFLPSLSLSNLPVLIVAFLAALPLTLWLSAYQGTALAGFYDAARGYPSEKASPDETCNSYDSASGGYSSEL
ncbi:MAG: DUF975 family protein [Intestinimonas sp.]|jgi:uncharacterized membrane protein|nr:DUF975 family protein [Intestinimonas sp.]